MKAITNIFIGIVLVVIVLSVFAIGALLAALVLMILWDWAVVGAFHVAQIAYWYWVGLVLILIIVGGFFKNWSR